MRPVILLALLLFVSIAPARAQPGVEPVVADTARVETAITEFVKQAYLTDWSAEPEHVRLNFAETVEYYWGRTAMPQEAVVEAKIAYARKWPRRAYRLHDDSLEVQAVPGRRDTYETRFRYDYHVERGGVRGSGVGETVLTLRLLPGRLQILAESGRIVSRGRQPD